MAESTTSEAWQRLDGHFGIHKRLESLDLVYLDANDIKTISGREPRLMTKFDTRCSRPPLLANATILPVTNGRYVLVPGDGYMDIGTGAKIRHWRLPSPATSLRSLPWELGPSSESQALDMALAAGILGDFLEEESLCLTIRGRRRSPAFDFKFHDVQLAVDGVQIEVDSGLEGRAIHLVEGKLGTRDDFHIRQLYYPFRMWRTLLPDKPTSALFMTWSNHVFQLRRYDFDPAISYHGIRLVSATDYLINNDPRVGTPLEQIIAQASPQPLPSEVPFPQADDIRKVIDVVDAIGKGCRTAEDIALLYDFDRRQADYYVNAAAFIGLVRRDAGAFATTPAGRQFVSSPLAVRNESILTRLATLPVFREALIEAHSGRAGLTTGAVEDWIRRATTLTGATVSRRARTVVAWTRWALDLINPMGEG